MTHVAIAGLTKTYPGRPPVPALRGIDLTIHSGGITAVLGPSGCGKTTLLRLIAGFERPDLGTITLDGRVVADPRSSLPPERRNVGIVPQEGALFPHLDVAGNVGFALRSMPRRDARARVGELLDLVGLAGLERRKPHELSGGQQQRVSLARALAPRPAVILLDEPFTALDVSLRSRLRADVAGVLRDADATAVLVTHDPEEALVMADQVAVMRSGVILQCAPSGEIYHHPVDIDTARMLGEVVVIRGDADGRSARCVLGEVRLSHTVAETNGPVQLVVRPEQIVADPAAPPSARVVDVQFYGHDALVGLMAGQGETVERVTARWPGTDLPRVGASVGVGIAGTATILSASGTASPAGPSAEPPGGDAADRIVDPAIHPSVDPAMEFAPDR